MTEEQFKKLIQAIIINGVIQSRFSKTPIEDVERARIITDHLLGEKQ